MSNVNRGIEVLRKNIKEMLEIRKKKKKLTEMNNSFEWVVSSLDTPEDMIRISEL